MTSCRSTVRLGQGPVSCAEPARRPASACSVLHLEFRGSPVQFDCPGRRLKQTLLLLGIVQAQNRGQALEEPTDLDDVLGLRLADADVVRPS